jgi:O-antigen ligase
MSLYYLLLVMSRFHSDPRVGKALFDTGFVFVTPVKIVGLLTVLVALLLPRPEEAAPRLRSPQSVLFLLFAILPVLETLAFSLPTPSTSISSLISFAFLMVATRLLVTTDDRMRKTVRVMILASTLASLWIYKEYFLQHFDRPGGLEQDPNYEALTLVTGIPLAIWMARHEISRWWRQIGAGCAGLTGLAVVITESRAGLIALGVMALATLVFTRRKLRTLALLTVVAIIFVGLVPAGLSQRFHSIKISGTPSNGDEESARIHFELLRAGIRMIGSNPIFGVGLDQFKSVAPEYNPNIYGLAGHSFIAHDTYIQVAAEGGLPTLVLFMALICLALVNCSAVRRSTDPALADLGRAMLLGLVAYGVAAASVTAEYVITLWLIVFLAQSLRDISAGAVKPAVSDALKQASVSARSSHGIANPHRPSIQRLPDRPSMSRA